jgi:iron-sulfur cluster repair protein YtfE (RIC family)
VAETATTREDEDMLPLRTGPKSAEEAQEPAAALQACHDRIRHFSTVALRLARSPNASARLVVDAASALRRYFGSALPAHERDEEDLVTPRLLEVRPGRAIEHALGRMAGDHRAIDEVLTRLDVMWARVLARPTDLAALGDEMHARARELSSLFEAHLQLEEETVFPAITSLLPEPARKQLLQTMHDRRTSEVRRTCDPAPR